MANVKRGVHLEQQLAGENFALQENAEHLQNHKTTFLHIMMDPRYDPEYNENLNMADDKNVTDRTKVMNIIGTICLELLLDVRD